MKRHARIDAGSLLLHFHGDDAEIRLSDVPGRMGREAMYRANVLSARHGHPLCFRLPELPGRNTKESPMNVVQR